MVDFSESVHRQVGAVAPLPCFTGRLAFTGEAGPAKPTSSALRKHELDKACKDKKASPDLSVSISFRPPPKARKASNRTPSPNNVVP